MRGIILTALTIAAISPAAAQTAAPTMTLYDLPGYLGRSVTVTTDTPDLATESFAKRAQSVRITGSWQVCPGVKFAGTCRTMTASMPYVKKSQIASIRPTPTTVATTTETPTSATAATPSAAGQTAAAVDIEALDVGSGTDGQDVTFYARPSLGGTEVSAGTNDITAATAFCKLAGSTSASYAGKARFQTSNLVDIAAKSKVRAYALRDVVCKR